MTDPVDLVEVGKARPIALTEDEHASLDKLKIATITKAVGRGNFTIKPGQKVGSVKVGSVQINVRPKVTEINRLLFLIGYCSNPAVWRDEAVHLERADGLFPAVAESFTRLASRAIEGGLLQGYRTRTDRLQLVRGRVRIGEQVTKNFGRPLPIAVEYDDFTTDIPENRLILLATLRLLSLSDISGGARGKLLQIRQALEDITVVPPVKGLPAWQPTRLNGRYHDALRLSDVIMRNGSFEQGVSNLRVTGFLFDMWRIFEDFVTSALSVAMRRIGGHGLPQAKLWLDTGSKIEMRPDLVWCQNDEHVAVVDAKYKAIRPKSIPDADIYQLFAYCVTLGLSEGHLVYAKGNEPVRTHAIVNCGVTIHCHALDLSQTPARLLESVDALAHFILRHSKPARQT
ncbi:restriction endonuclease [Nocardia sp. NPDC004654]|uniref:McrC family protein n=1 Tax=Nocardia sp. NPDC004654 TaxID=3154776 RepID=UPI0033A52533